MTQTALSSYIVANPGQWCEEFCHTLVWTAYNCKVAPISLDVTIEPFSIQDVKSWITWGWDFNDEQTSLSFARKMEKGKPLPPVIFVDGCLEDGFHRLFAADRLGMKEAPTLNWQSHKEQTNGQKT